MPSPGLRSLTAEATSWEAARTERSFSNRPGPGLGSGPSSVLLSGPGSAAPVVSEGPTVGSGVMSSSSANGVGGEPPSRSSAYWYDPHFGTHYDNSTDRNMTAQPGKSALLHCRISQLGERTVSPRRSCDVVAYYTAWRPPKNGKEESPKFWN
ncbi:hypothetical protein IscW_ISCW015080 [Ixodes scapularis]|uniref:Uncharacterized protein n=1 Tax=Ixodes scapularis TaxID=6945 RepID=B7QIT9_IXOSC|nr:hypothetical protein IscW_ISCW015080 [Ixodes scapularis]|eukprot:XP_002415096.1 hypothetical protein IscW_ISCW015080 [Ixodes scapularis]